MTGLSAGVTFWFRARLVDRTGNIGPWSDWVMGQSSADATAILEYITGQISETELGQSLLARINLIDGDGPGSVNDRIGALADAIEYSPNNAYLAGDSVRDGQRLYQAKIDVPADAVGANAPPNTTYWLDVGQVVQSADGLALQVSQNTASLELLDGKVTAAASSLEVLQAAYRDDDGEGDLAAALNGWDSSARITEESRTRASDNEAMAERVTQLQASVGDNSAAIQTTQQTVASLNGDLSAMYSVKLQLTQDGKYYAAGMGLGIENTPEGMQSQVLFQADRFAVINTANGVISTPFVIQGGQVFINSAVIGDGTIDMAKIATALQSTNYVAGEQGWRLDKAGTFELNGSVAGQGRMKITNQLVEVFDSNGVRRVRLGIWA
jgi:predicted phage tail protein